MGSGSLPAHPPSMAEGLGPGCGPSREVKAIAGATPHPKAAPWPGSAPQAAASPL